MDCAVQREDLLRSLYIVQGVAERKTPLPILSHILAETSGDNLTLAATDLEVSVRQICPAAVKKPGAFTVDARKVYEIVRELPEGLIGFKLGEGGWVSMTAQNSRFRLASLDPREFPSFPGPKAEDAQSAPGSPQAVSIPADRLREMLEKTLFAAAVDDTRQALNGILLEGRPSGKLRMAASDGHRLAMIDRAVTIGEPDSW